MNDNDTYLYIDSYLVAVFTDLPVCKLCIRQSKRDQFCCIYKRALCGTAFSM